MDLVVVLEEVEEVAAATWLCVVELGATEVDVVLDDVGLAAEVDNETAWVADEVGLNETAL